MLATISLYVVLFVAGRIASWLIYQSCWSNSLQRRFHPLGATITFLRRPAPWLFHIPVLYLVALVSWDEHPALQQAAIMLNFLLAIGAIFRFGAADLHQFFWFDRVLAFAFAIGVCFAPVFLFPSILVSCCLQYTVSGWKLGPGYSNLLGYEFIRGSNCVLLACIAYCGLSNVIGIANEHFDSLAIAVLLGFQASLYVNNAFAKAVLGENWLSWIFKNRIQCLVVNAYLRGWMSNWISKSFVMQLAGTIGKLRIPLCAAVFALELSFVAILVNPRLSVAILASAALFHIVVFVLTGLLEVEYVVNHLTFSWLILRPGLDGVFRIDFLIASLFCLMVSWAWVGTVWSRIARAYEETGAAGRFAKFGDAADLLMAWWDSPFMRMFSYSVETSSGRRANWPVTRMSPYDTALTDIHTHVMILNAHRGLDPQADNDRRVVRTGVWGLVRTIRERDFLYSLMDCPAPDLSQFRSHPLDATWTIAADDEGPEAAAPLRDLFCGMNDYQRAAWFRTLMIWPHFPGEDLVPDICPLVEDGVPRYAFEEPAAAVTLTRIKTFYTGDDIVPIEKSLVGTIRMDHRQQEAS